MVTPGKNSKFVQVDVSCPEGVLVMINCRQAVLYRSPLHQFAAIFSRLSRAVHTLIIQMIDCLYILNALRDSTDLRVVSFCKTFCSRLAAKENHWNSFMFQFSSAI